jgi:hypothetical protein
VRNMSCGYSEYQRMFIYHDLPSSTFPNIFPTTWVNMFQHLNNTFGYISYIFLHVLFMLHLTNFVVYIHHANVMLHVMSYGFHCIMILYHRLNKCYYIVCTIHIVSSHHIFNYIITHVARHFTSSQMIPHCK